MPKTAVHLHIFYTDMWPVFRSYLQNLREVDFDLYITLIKENEALQKEILKAFPAATIWIVPNSGYDIGPFFYFLRHIDIKKYPYILKLHGKNEKRYCITQVNGLYLTRKIWNKLLLHALLGSPEIVRRNYAAMEQHPDIGLISSSHLIASDSRHYKNLEPQINEIMSHLGFSETPVCFIAGTMFLIRSSLLKPLLDAGYDIDSFDTSDVKIHDGTLAHVMERVIGTLTIAQNYRICGLDKCRYLRLNSFLHRILRFVFQKKVSRQDYLTVKIFRIPVYRKKLS